jgi:hypothetical protein
MKFYPLNLLRHLKNYILRIRKWFRGNEFIPLEISDEEILVRGIVAPFFVSSKNILKREAFLPKNLDSGVSLLRLDFTTEDFCKNHSAALVFPNNSYKGLGTINKKMIFTINSNKEISEEAYINGTPIDEFNNYRKDNLIGKTDKGLPMHADLYYSGQMQEGAVQTKYRQYANQLAKHAIYYEDPNPKIKNWNGEKLNCTFEA